MIPIMIGVTLIAVILFMGKVSGCHLNPAISIAFAARRDFPWRRVPGYIVAQIVGQLRGRTLLLTAFVGVSASNGGSYPGEGVSPLTAMFIEMMLTFGPASVVMGTVGSTGVGLFAAIGVGGYITATAMWAGPLTGSSMDPARTLGPNIVGGDIGPIWVYIIGPVLGGLPRGRLRLPLLRGHGVEQRPARWRRVRWAMPATAPRPSHPTSSTSGAAPKGHDQT